MRQVTNLYLGEYTYATLPAAASCSKCSATVTDIGGGTIWRSNGTRWKPLNGIATVHTLDAAVTAAADTTENLLTQFLLPANSLQQYDRLNSKITILKSAGVESATINIRMGTTGTSGDTQIMSQTSLATTSVGVGYLFNFKLLSATSIQKMGNGSTSAPYGGASTTAMPAAITTSSFVTNPMYISIYGKFTTNATSETVTIRDADFQIISTVN